MPHCCDCQRDDLPRDAFSKAQFKKAATERRCKACAAALLTISDSAPPNTVDTASSSEPSTGPIVASSLPSSMETTTAPVVPKEEQHEKEISVNHSSGEQPAPAAASIDVMEVVADVVTPEQEASSQETVSETLMEKSDGDSKQPETNNLSSLDDDEKNQEEEEEEEGSTSSNRHPHPLAMLEQLSERFHLSPNSDHGKVKDDVVNNNKEDLETEKKRQMELLRESLQQVDASLVETLDAQQQAQAQLVEKALSESKSKELSIVEAFEHEDGQFDLELAEGEVDETEGPTTSTMVVDNEKERSPEIVDENSKTLVVDKEEEVVEHTQPVPTDDASHETVAKGQKANPLDLFKLQLSGGRSILTISPSQPAGRLENEKQRQSQLLHEKMKELRLEDLEVDLDQQQEAQSKLVQEAMEASASSRITLEHDEVEGSKSNNRSASNVLGAVGGWLTGSSHHSKGKNTTSDAEAEDGEEVSKDLGSTSDGTTTITTQKNFLSSVGGWLSGSSHHSTSKDTTDKANIDSNESTGSPSDKSLHAEEDKKEETNSAKSFKERILALVEESSAEELREKLIREIMGDDAAKGLPFHTIPSLPVVESIVLSPSHREVKEKNGPASSTPTTRDLEEESSLLSDSSHTLREILKESKAATKTNATTTKNPSISGGMNTPKAAARDARRARVLENMHRLDAAMEQAKKKRSK